MSINDPLGDMLTRIRNAQMRRRPKVVTPASNIRGRVLDVLAEEGYIRGYTRVEQISNSTPTPNMAGVDIVHFPVSLIPNHQQVLRIEHAQTLIHIVERDVESKILLSQFLPNAPSRHRPNKADTEAADDGCQRNGDRAGRHGIGVNDFHHRKGDGDAKHAGKSDHSPVAILAEIAQRSKHGLAPGRCLCLPVIAQFWRINSVVVLNSDTSDG